MKLRNTLVLLLLTTVIACTPKIDASSVESTASSLEKVRKSLNEEKRSQFEESLGAIVIDGLNLGGIAKGLIEGANIQAAIIPDSIRISLDGLNADDVIAKGGAIIQRIAAEKLAKAKVELDELMAKKSAAESAKLELAKFKISDARFYKQKTGNYYVTEEPVIEFKVENGTAFAISRAFFQGTLKSPDRSVPWLVDDFNYSIPGGLEPGESAQWRLAPNMFSDWGEVDAPSDAVLLIETTKIYGPSGESLFDAGQFSERDAEKVDEILAEFPELKS